MVKRFYRKLVRDKIPVIIKAKGRAPRIRKLNKKEFKTLLRKN